MNKTTRFVSLGLLSFILSALSYGQTSANYNVSVTTSWNATDHGSIADNNLPNDPHWSPLAIVTHKNPNEFLQLGEIASQGVQNIAEFGGTSSFQNEVNAAIMANNADQYKQASFGPRGAISTASINNLTVSETYPLVTFLSMIAPSPDWFIAINSETLRSGNDNLNNGWKATYSIDLFVYDAGTDDGIDYESANAASNPKVGIFMINGAPLNGIKAATATFTLNSTLSNLDVEKANTFKIFPNPVTSGEVFISNIQQNPIESIEIYAILGNLLKRHIISTDNSNVKLDVSEFNSGIYILKISTKSGNGLSQKLIIK